MSHNKTFRQSCQHRAILLFLLLVAALAVWLVQHMIYSLPPLLDRMARLGPHDSHIVQWSNESAAINSGNAVEVGNK